jgi:hypothetical protein
VLQAPGHLTDSARILIPAEVAAARPPAEISTRMQEQRTDPATSRPFCISHSARCCPLYRVLTLNKLRSALLNLRERSSNAARLQGIVTACRAALDERTRDRVPPDWAGSWGNLA